MIIRYLERFRLQTIGGFLLLGDLGKDPTILGFLLGGGSWFGGSWEGSYYFWVLLGFLIVCNSHA